MDDLGLAELKVNVKSFKSWEGPEATNPTGNHGHFRALYLHRVTHFFIKKFLSILHNGFQLYNENKRSKEYNCCCRWINTCSKLTELPGILVQHLVIISRICNSDVTKLVGANWVPSLQPRNQGNMPGGNNVVIPSCLLKRTLFHCVFRLRYHVQSTVAQNFH